LNYPKKNTVSTLISSEGAAQMLYLIDFGISTPFVGKDGKLLP
jgi:hypothetical protein